MTAIDSEFRYCAKIFGCRGRQSLPEQLAGLPDDIGRSETSCMPGRVIHKGIGFRPGASKTEIESEGFRSNHGVVPVARVKRPGAAWGTGAGIHELLHILRRNRKRLVQPFVGHHVTSCPTSVDP